MAVFLDAEKTIVIAKEEEQKLRGNEYASAYVFQEQLFKHTGDLLYQDRMIEDYPGYVDDLRPLVVDSIGRTPANPTTVAFLKHVVLREVNASAVARAAYKLGCSAERSACHGSRRGEMRPSDLLVAKRKAMA